MSGVTHDGQRWSNADQDRVELVAYDPSWPARYEAEARAIRAALAGLADFELVHFGSTAIPGLAAKAIIDITLTSGDRSAWPALIEPIETLRYVFWADNPRRDRLSGAPITCASAPRRRRGPPSSSAIISAVTRRRRRGTPR